MGNCCPTAAFYAAAFAPSPPRCRQTGDDAAATRALLAAPADAPRYEQLSGTTLARCVDVYDGDTLTVLLLHDGQPVRRRCRCLGYDSPEMRGAAANKPLALAAREHLKGLVPSGVFRIHFRGTDKYGRLLVSFPVGGEPLAAHMIRAGHGYEYHGGAKEGGASARPPPGAR